MLLGVHDTGAWFYNDAPNRGLNKKGQTTKVVWPLYRMVCWLSAQILNPYPTLRIAPRLIRVHERAGIVLRHGI